MANKLPPVSSLSNSSYNSATAQLSLPNLLQMPNAQIMHQTSHQPSMRTQGQTTVLGLLNASSHGQSLSSLQSQAHQIQRITGTNMSGNSMLMVQQLQQINDQSQQIRMTQPPQQQHPQHQPQQHSLCMQQNFLQQLHNGMEYLNNCL
ncbi:nuclear transcription factor Y subunit gamma-like [Anneissia japonica]|uniref:nuclear transcription factor Y subunit gamma-like n=1 Tax=Anneissia japonica TaxID=1529436 RepID=UPI00142578DE|nr:nuclear transcription factor Y subunit gamma-like [Anneissia japonica]